MYITRHYQKMFFCIACFVYVAFGAMSQENRTVVSGYIEYDDVAVSFANVVLKEIDELAYTDETGYFEFFDVPYGTYTLLVIADTYEEQEFTITVNSEYADGQSYQLNVQNNEDVFVAEEIVVTSERFDDSTSGQRTFSKQEVMNLPLVGDDPISLVQQEPGVIYQTELFRDRSVANVQGQLYSLSREFSIYGSDTAWNRYFYDFIQIPNNTHVSNPDTSVITRRAVDGLISFKGMPTGLYGQGIGSTLVLLPRTDEKNYIQLDVSLTDPAVIFNYWITKNISLFFSVRQSISQWTVVPLANLIIENTEDTAGSIDENIYGDALFSMTFQYDNHEVRLIGLAYYDKFVANLNITPSSEDVNQADSDLDVLPIFYGGGVRWNALIRDNLKNVLASYTTYYVSTSDLLFDIRGDESVFYAYEGYVDTLDYKLQNSLTWIVNDTNVLTFGLEFQYLRVTATHTDEFGFENAPLGITQTLDEAQYTLDENIYKLYGFTDYGWTVENMETTVTLGLSQLLGVSSDALSTFPSGGVLHDYNFLDNWKLSSAISVSPAFINGPQYGDRIISEKTSDFDSITQYLRPTYGLTTASRLTWQVSNEHSLFLEPFFAYYFNFSGFVPSLTVANVPGTPRGYLYISPEEGIGTGVSMEWAMKLTYHLLNISYTLGYAFYNTEDYGWIPPSNDYRHQLKISYIFNKFKPFNFGIVGSILFDVPFTPVTATENVNIITNETIRIKGDPWSARNYVPLYSLVVNVSGTIYETERAKFTYRFQPGDLVSIFNWTLDTEDINTQTPGASNSNVDNRTYSFEFQPINLLTSLYLSFTVEIELP